MDKKKFKKMFGKLPDETDFRFFDMSKKDLMHVIRHEANDNVVSSAMNVLHYKNSLS